MKKRTSKVSRRIVSLLMSMVLTLTLVTPAAFAESDMPDNGQQQEQQVPTDAGNGGSGPAPEELLPGSVLNRIVVPKKITVHLGKPSANVRNVTVSFQSYIANVASSEVYPTWDSAPGTRRTSI